MLPFIPFLRHSVVIPSFIWFYSHVASAQYTLSDEYTPANFFDKFNFYAGKDPTNGFVQYINQTTASDLGLISTGYNNVSWGVDHDNVLASDGVGRSSIRLESKAIFTKGLFILDVTHMPFGCGTWPAWWTVGLNWPEQGEIDIIEGVNINTGDSMALHTGENCSVSGNGQTATLKTNDCYAWGNEGVNLGCGSTIQDTESYGEGFNSKEGGVYAMEWTSNWIRVWFWSRQNIPHDLTEGQPDPSTWGTPAGNWQGSCDIDLHFQDHNIIFDTTFCGDYAGNAYGGTKCPQYPNKMSVESCKQYVANNPADFANAFWTIRSMRVFQNEVLITSLASGVTQLPTATPEVSVSLSVDKGMGNGSIGTSVVFATIPTTLSFTSASGYTGPNTETETSASRSLTTSSSSSDTAATSSSSGDLASSGDRTSSSISDKAATLNSSRNLASSGERTPFSSSDRAATSSSPGNSASSGDGTSSSSDRAAKSNSFGSLASSGKKTTFLSSDGTVTSSSPGNLASSGDKISSSSSERAATSSSSRDPASSSDRASLTNAISPPTSASETIGSPYNTTLVKSQITVSGSPEAIVTSTVSSTVGVSTTPGYTFPTTFRGTWPQGQIIECPGADNYLYEAKTSEVDFGIQCFTQYQGTGILARDNMEKSLHSESLAKRSPIPAESLNECIEACAAISTCRATRYFSISPGFCYLLANVTGTYISPLSFGAFVVTRAVDASGSTIIPTLIASQVSVPILTSSPGLSSISFVSPVSSAGNTTVTSCRPLPRDTVTVFLSTTVESCPTPLTCPASLN